ncbi:MAG: type II toxin-antitoxin system VapC family toxin [Methylocystis sp.]|nr:type II toxin-antitoxin system VapC family toxin [Methylocystis sp.]
MTRFIVDASVVAAWLLPDEATPETDALLDRLVMNRALAPDLLAHEVRSLLLTARRRSRITEAHVPWALNRFEQLSIDNAGAGGALNVVTLAERRNLSTYDAAYLALAQIERLPLATLDKRLRAAAAAEDVAVLPEWRS